MTTVTELYHQTLAERGYTADAAQAARRRLAAALPGRMGRLQGAALQCGDQVLVQPPLPRGVRTCSAASAAARAS